MGNRPRLLILILLCLGQMSNQLVLAQGIRAFNDNVDNVIATDGRTYHDMFKVTAIYLYRKGLSIGASYGFWKETNAVQYALNTGFMYRLGKRFLGNYYNGAYPTDARSKGQFVFMFSPLLTADLGSKYYVYQEVEPFYLGTPNAVFCRYAYSLTIGTTFTISPRGTYSNVPTARNRSQQVMMVSLNLREFNLTVYDDYLSKLTELFELGDNWDRFFTGGGFIRYRVNDQLTLHAYSEVYTGINRAIAFLNPDVISYVAGKSGWMQKNFANQDPGQEFFNTAWFILEGSYSSTQVVSNSAGIYTPEVNLFVGSSAPWTMFSQRAIHSIIQYDTLNDLKFHYFVNRSDIPGNLEAGGKNNMQMNMNSLFVGAGFAYNIH
jgi:hypothetical protein